MSDWVDRILKYGLSAALVLASGISVQGTLYGAHKTPSKVRQSDVIQKLGSADWVQRSEAVTALRSVPASHWAAQVRDSLIEVFRMEQGRLRAKLEGRVPSSSFPEMHREAFGEYYSALAGLVMEINDSRALPLVVNFPSSPDPRVLMYIAKRGRSALPLVLARLDRAGQRADVGPEWTMLDALTQLVLTNRTEDLPQPLSESDLTTVRVAAMRFLNSENSWVVAHAARTLAAVADPQDQNRVKEVFARLLTDPDHNRREIALSTMRGIKDPHFLPIDELKRVAKHDDFRLAGPGAGYPAGAYPLRQEAERILRGFHPAK